MAAKTPVRIWVGTRRGAFLFSSKDRKKWDTHTRDAGDSWHVLASHLPPIHSPSAALD